MDTSFKQEHYSWILILDCRNKMPSGFAWRTVNKQTINYEQYLHFLQKFIYLTIVADAWCHPQGWDRTCTQCTACVQFSRISVSKVFPTYFAATYLTLALSSQWETTFLFFLTDSQEASWIWIVMITHIRNCKHIACAAEAIFCCPTENSHHLNPKYYQKMQRSTTRKNQEEHGPDVM
jgi:hypothetical protein